MTETELKEVEGNISSSGHRRLGESHSQGVYRIQEEIHVAATNISTGQVNSDMTCGNNIDCCFFIDHKNMNFLIMGGRREESIASLFCC